MQAAGLCSLPAGARSGGGAPASGAQQAVFRTDKQLSRRQAQLRGLEVDRGGGGVCGACSVVCWGGECTTPLPLFPFPSLSQLPVDRRQAPQRKRWGELGREVRRRVGAERLAQERLKG